MEPKQHPSLIPAIAASAAVSLVVSGLIFGIVLPRSTQGATENISAPAASRVQDQNPDDSPVVRTVQRADPAVVSVIISKDVPVIERSIERSPYAFPQIIERQNGTVRRDIGGGTAFFVSADGILMTNKHVVSDASADYTVFLNDGRQLKATVLGLDPSNDIALLKVSGSDFPYLTFSQNAEPVLGQSVVAIGNALGEFRNTVSVGVVSGLGRSIIAGGLLGGEAEQLDSIIQTDAAINEGNSGGPLLDLQGNVVGMNTAVAGNAEGIAFAIPAGDLQSVLEGYGTYGRIVRPYLGVRYQQVTPSVKELHRLTVDEGVLAVAGEQADEPAVVAGSPADKAGIKEGDVLLDIDGRKLTADVSLSSLIQRKLPGDKITVKILRDGQEKTLTVTLEERKS